MRKSWVAVVSLVLCTDASLGEAASAPQPKRNGTKRVTALAGEVKAAVRRLVVSDAVKRLLLSEGLLVPTLRQELIELRVERANRYWTNRRNMYERLVSVTKDGEVDAKYEAFLDAAYEARSSAKRKELLLDAQRRRKELEHSGKKVRISMREYVIEQYIAANLN